MQNIVSKKCDKCDQRATSYSSGHGQFCDKHWNDQPINKLLRKWKEEDKEAAKKRREELKRKVAQTILIHRTRIPFTVSIDELAEKILKELGL